MDEKSKKLKTPEYIDKDGKPTGKSIMGDGDVDGPVDDAWFESVKKYVPEIIWNPDHPGRKDKK